MEYQQAFRGFGVCALSHLHFCLNNPDNIIMIHVWLRKGWQEQHPLRHNKGNDSPAKNAKSQEDNTQGASTSQLKINNIFFQHSTQMTPPSRTIWKLHYCTLCFYVRQHWSPCTWVKLSRHPTVFSYCSEIIHL